MNSRQLAARIAHKMLRRAIWHGYGDILSEEDRLEGLRSLLGDLYKKGDVVLVYDRSTVTLDDKSVLRLRSLVSARRDPLGFVSNYSKTGRHDASIWYAYYTKGVRFSVSEKSYPVNRSEAEFKDLKRAIQRVRQGAQAGSEELLVPTQEIQNILDEAMKFAARKVRDIAVQISLESYGSKPSADVTFEVHSTYKRDFKRLRDLKMKTFEHLKGMWPHRTYLTVKRGGKDIWYGGYLPVSITRSEATTTVVALRLPLTAEEAIDKNILSRRVQALNRKYHKEIQQERKEEAERKWEEERPERERREREERERKEKELAAKIKSLGPDGAALYHNMKSLEQAAHSAQDEWVSDFVDSALNMLMNRGSISEKMLRVVNRNLDKYGIKRKVPKEEATQLREQLAKNQAIIQRINEAPKNPRTRDIMQSFKQQLENGYTLSPKQMALLDKWAPAPAGTPSEIAADFKRLHSLLSRKAVPALAEATAQVFAGDGKPDEGKKAAKEIEADFKKWVKGDAYTWSWGTQQLVRMVLPSFSTLPYLEDDWLYELRDQVLKAQKAKTPTMKAKKLITQMRKINEGLGAITQPALVEQIVAAYG